jgi:hypothetical protein
MSVSSLSLKNILTLIIISFFVAVGSFSLVSAQTKDELCRGANLTFNESGSGGDIKCSTDDQGNPVQGGNVSSLNNLVTTIINIFSLVVGILAVIMIIWGGFRFITSGGDSTKVTSARNTIIYAIIGLVIVALAQTIAKFVLEKTPTG